MVSLATAAMDRLALDRNVMDRSGRVLGYTGLHTAAVARRRKVGRRRTTIVLLRTPAPLISHGILPLFSQFFNEKIYIDNFCFVLQTTWWTATVRAARAAAWTTAAGCTSSTRCTRWCATRCSSCSSRCASSSTRPSSPPSTMACRTRSETPLTSATRYTRPTFTFGHFLKVVMFCALCILF